MLSGPQLDQERVRTSRELAFGERLIEAGQRSEAQGEDIVPIPGTSSIERLEDNARAVDVRLSAGDLAEIDAIAPKGAASGQRYAPGMMEMVNR